MTSHGKKTLISTGIVTDNVACLPPEPVGIYVTQLTPVMGVHTGPGVPGIAFYRGD